MIKLDTCKFNLILFSQYRLVLGFNFTFVHKVLVLYVQQTVPNTNFGQF